MHTQLLAANNRKLRCNTQPQCNMFANRKPHAHTESALLQPKFIVRRSKRMSDFSRICVRLFSPVSVSFNKKHSVALSAAFLTFVFFRVSMTKTLKLQHSYLWCPMVQWLTANCQ